MKPTTKKISFVIALVLIVTAAICFFALFNEEKSKFNLVFISLDTVRRDHLTIYGYKRNTTPVLSDFANKAIVFNNAFAQSTLTNPSHASMFTGVYPIVHGNQENAQILASDQVTLAQILYNTGFRTGGFVSGFTMRRKNSGFDRGFEVYDDRISGLRRDGKIATQLAIRWLHSLKDNERYFLFLHLYDAHGPYNPRIYAGMFKSKEHGLRLNYVPEYQRVRDANGRYSKDLNWYIDRYDGAIRYDDKLVGELLSNVNLERTVVVILADHGETLGERFFKLAHGGSVFDEQIRIPLMIYVPGIKPRRVDAIVETVDLLPTLADLLGIDLPPNRPVQGKSLVPLLRGETEFERKVTFSSARPSSIRHADRGYHLDLNRRIYSVRSSRWKLIQYPGEKTDYFELYDLRSDPKEKSNLINAFPKVVSTYKKYLHEWLKNAVVRELNRDLAPDVKEKLRSLGYIGQ